MRIIAVNEQRVSLEDSNIRIDDFGQYRLLEEHADDDCVRMTRYDFLLVSYSDLRSR